MLVAGGSGYIGAMLVPQLVALDGHEVTTFDIEWFGSGQHMDNPRVKFVKGDVRDIRAVRDACAGQDAVIWLASLSNNEMCIREPVIHDRVNRDAVPIALFAALIAGSVRHFIYASSVAAYGSCENALEDQELNPTTPYGEAKKYAEEWVKHYNGHMGRFYTTIVRSASVCGYSLNMRFDLTVNKMVYDACTKGVIKVNGGQQKRCHIHMQDICGEYRRLLGAPAGYVAGHAFNFVAENQSVLETANIVAEETGARIEIGPATDDRSYTVNDGKARHWLDFMPKHTVRDAVREVMVRLQGGYWADHATNPAYFNMAEGLR